MKTRARKLAFPILTPVLVACASSGPTLENGTDVAALNGATVEVSSEGGIAALSIKQSVEHDTRAFVAVQRRLCSTTCGVPSDTANGTLSRSTTDSVFTVVLALARSLQNDNFGTTSAGADMMMYTIRITSNGRVRTLRGDDGTLPEAARKIMSTVRQAISAARGR